MRRGYLYNKARELGCNKIALGHHFDDVIETILMGMLYGSQVQTMMPKLHSSFHKGMELIRPMYFVKEEAIINWKKHNNLEFINCACRFTENCFVNDDSDSKRLEMKNLVKELRKKNKNIDYNIFKALDNVNLNCILGTKKDGIYKSFLENYDDKN
jgi:tRNA(Ile)-lysidine synthase TilS/MesJ